MALPTDNLSVEELFNTLGVTEGEQIFYNANGTKKSLVEFKQKVKGKFNTSFCKDAETCLQRQDLRSFLGFTKGNLYITDDCINCGYCYEFCKGDIKIDAILYEPEKQGVKYSIDYSKCNNCNECMQICPVECIKKA